jgi:hypothetical protein
VKNKLPSLMLTVLSGAIWCAAVPRSHAGAIEPDDARRAYTVAGGGANMWSTNDAFHFVWKKVSGDVSLAADRHPFHPGFSLCVSEGLTSAQRGNQK